MLQRLDWTVIRRLDGLLQGDYRTLFRGFGFEMAEYANTTQSQSIWPGSSGELLQEGSGPADGAESVGLVPINERTSLGEHASLGRREARGDAARIREAG